MQTLGFKFEAGQIVATPGAIDALAKANESASTYLRRHFTGDWGNMSADDKAQNDEAIAHEGILDQQDRVMSGYELTDSTRIWIITEYDRSVTTVLLPSEY